jgi:hypothetical protein
MLLPLQSLQYNTNTLLLQLIYIYYCTNSCIATKMTASCITVINILLQYCIMLHQVNLCSHTIACSNAAVAALVASQPQLLLLHRFVTQQLIQCYSICYASALLPRMCSCSTQCILAAPSVCCNAAASGFGRHSYSNTFIQLPSTVCGLLPRHRQQALYCACCIYREYI